MHVVAWFVVFGFIFVDQVSNPNSPTLGPHHRMQAMSSYLFLPARLAVLRISSTTEANQIDDDRKVSLGLFIRCLVRRRIEIHYFLLNCSFVTNHRKHETLAIYMGTFFGS